MSLRQSYIDPVSTNQILNSLNSAIDEAKLVTTLANMSNRIQQLESVSGPSKRSESLRKEIKILEIQINYIRDHAAF